MLRAKGGETNAIRRGLRQTSKAAISNRFPFQGNLADQNRLVLAPEGRIMLTNWFRIDVFLRLF